MHVFFLVLSSLSGLALITSSLAAQDFKIVTRHQTTGPASTYTQYFSGSRSRHEYTSNLNGVEARSLATITWRGQGTNEVYTLDLENHEYTRHQTDSRGIALGVRPIPREPSDTVLDIWIESTDTGEQQEMFGYTARHIITREKRVPGPGAHSQASESETDGWYIDYDAAPEPVRRTKGSFSMLVAFSGGRDEIKFHRSGAVVGYPLKTRITNRSHFTGADGKPTEYASTSTQEVVEISRGPLDPSLFEIPKDFREVAQLRQISNARPLSLWEQFRNWLEDLFS